MQPARQRRGFMAALKDIGGNMFNRTILVTDLSPASDAAVNCLGGLKAYGAAHILLLQCLSLQEATSVALTYSTEILHERLRGEKAALEKQGFKVETRIVPGFPLRELERVAAEEKYALIVVGTVKHSLAADAFMRGITADIVQYSKVPVLVLRLAAQPGGEARCVRAGSGKLDGHVLFPTDFSENADNAFVYAEKMAAAGARRITLMHVQDKGKIDPHLKHKLEEFNRIDRERLEELKAKLHRQGKAQVDVELCYGSPAAEIMRAVREKKIDLVVMGSQGRGYVKELFLGSVSHNVARRAEAPVLLVPAGR